VARWPGGWPAERVEGVHVDLWADRTRAPARLVAEALRTPADAAGKPVARFIDDARPALTGAACAACAGV